MKIIVVFIFLLLAILYYIISRTEDKFFKDMHQTAIQTKSIIKEMNEVEGNEKMNVYIVICNGKVSSEAYRTLKEAEAFCESRGAKKVINRWLFTDNDDVYQITDVQVRKGKGEK